MADITAQERGNILKLVAGMFNAAPGAGYLKEFGDAYAAMGRDYTALARALGGTQAFLGQYPQGMGSVAFAAKFLSGLGLQANTEAQQWVYAKLQSGASHADVMVQALVAIVESRDPAFADAQRLLSNKAALAEYYSATLGKSSEDLAYLQSTLSKVTAQSDVSTPQALAALLAAGTGEPTEPTQPTEPTEPTTPTEPVENWLEVATPANASTVLRDLPADAQLRISGKNQTAVAPSADQRFDTISVEAARGETLKVLLDNTSHNAGTLRVNLLQLRDHPLDSSVTSAVRTLSLVSGGEGGVLNQIQSLDAARVGTFKFSGTQALDVGLTNAARYQDASSQVMALAVDASELKGSLHLRLNSSLLNKVDASQSVRLVGGQSGDDVLDLSGGVLTTARTAVSGFEVISFQGGRFDAASTTGVALYKSDGSELRLLNLKAVENAQVGSYDVATQAGVNAGALQQFHTTAATADAQLNLVFKASAGPAITQKVATSGYATVAIKLDTLATQPAAQKQFVLDLGSTAVDALGQAVVPLSGDFAQASAVPATHWTKTQLHSLVVTGGSGLVNGVVQDRLDLQTASLPASLKTIDVSGYQGLVSLALQAPLVSTIAGTQYSTGNTTIKVGAYGLDAVDVARTAGVQTITVFEFTADALAAAGMAGSPFVWRIENFMGYREAGGGLSNQTTLKVGALGVHGVQDMQVVQQGADTVITGAAGQNFKIVLAGQVATELGSENFWFA